MNEMMKSNMLKSPSRLLSIDLLRVVLVARENSCK